MSSTWPVIYAGESVTLRVPNVRDADTGDALDLSAATAIEWQLRRRVRMPGQADDNATNPVILAKDLAGGVTPDGADILIDLDAGDTSELNGKFYADCWATIAGKRRLVVAPAPMTILPVVNPP